VNYVEHIRLSHTYFSFLVIPSKGVGVR